MLHRDIRPDNVGIGRGGVVKVGVVMPVTVVVVVVVVVVGGGGGSGNSHGGSGDGGGWRGGTSKRLSNVAVDAVFDDISIATTFKEE